MIARLVGARLSERLGQTVVVDNRPAASGIVGTDLVAKANPGKLNYGSSGPGSSAHLATELLMSMAGIQMTHVPYKGVAQYVTAQLGNEIQSSLSNMFSTPEAFAQVIKADAEKWGAVGKRLGVKLD